LIPLTLEPDIPEDKAQTFKLEKSESIAIAEVELLLDKTRLKRLIEDLNNTLKILETGGG